MCIDIKVMKIQLDIKNEYKEYTFENKENTIVNVINIINSRWKAMPELYSIRSINQDIFMSKLEKNSVEIVVLCSMGDSIIAVINNLKSILSEYICDELDINTKECILKANKPSIISSNQLKEIVFTVVTSQSKISNQKVLREIYITQQGVV